MGQKVQCPRITCRSKDVEPVGVTQKRKVTTLLLTTKKEATFKCNKCGHIFTIKL